MGTMNINMEVCLEMNLGQQVEQFKVTPARLRGGQRGFAGFYCACYDVDASYGMFVIPNDKLKVFVFNDKGEILWRREDGVMPGPPWYTYRALDMDGDGIDELYFVTTIDPEHPFKLSGFVLQRIDIMTGEVTGQWPWPHKQGNRKSLSFTFRNHITGGYVHGKPVLVTVQGTYEDMYFQAWNPDMSIRWEKDILLSDPGARGSHSYPVVDINGDGVDELQWGERSISFDDGHELFCIERDSWRGHSDQCQPVWNEERREWTIYINRETDEDQGPRVGIYDSKGQPIWTALESGHIHKGWTGRIGENGELVSIACGIKGQMKDTVGRYYTGVTEHAFDAMTGKEIKYPFSVFDTAPVDVSGDGLHEILRGVAEGKTELLDRKGNVIREMGGRVAMASKILDYPGEQVMTYHSDGFLRFWRDTNAVDSERALLRYSNPFYRANQYSRTVEGNICMLGGI